MAGNSDFQIVDGVLVKYVGKGGDATIPDSVASIGKPAFNGCNSLKNAVFEDPTDWKVSKNNDMSDARAVHMLFAKTAAKYLRDKYADRYWKRG